MRIVWHSNHPAAPSGYGQQTALFAPLIRNHGHDLAISAFWGIAGHVGDWHGIKIYPADRNYGNQWLPIIATAHGDGDPADVLVITLMDVWVLRSKLLKELNLASWVPIDHAPVPPLVLAYFQHTQATPIAMSRFGQQALEQAGIDALYVPHGVDTQTMRPPDPGGRDQFRQQLGVDADRFVVGMVAANKGNAPARKAFPAAFMAFGIFHREHPDSILYLHTELDTGDSNDLNLPRWLELCHIPLDAVKVTPQFDLFAGVPADRMASMYGAFDVLLNPSYGEGFGVPIIEAQACGTPVIVNDFSSMPELCGAGWLVDGIPIAHEAMGSWWKAPDIGSIVAALDAAYQARGDQALRAQARQFALTYDHHTVMADHWTPVLVELEQRAHARNAPPPTGPRLQPKALAA
jgi:glycosyltransferase involved in cell wall biosynthesis